ncbi:hypothetical protein ASA1KI_02740 [Opitutales bacterium ASA1]|jgi:glutaredoxin|uniref:glutaredoxin family protein n=1 Tax=Congregicoccus parvus TaxID=3081749 RepID=UPI002B2CC0AA|nr:hypothetical protein ASA1KI_02740 [Opitutales bacterium ASA1]
MTTTQELPILYVKPGCPWCADAIEFLDRVGVSHREVDVLSDRDAADDMRIASGQEKAPTLDWHGSILADFDVEQLRDFLRSKDVEFEDS